MSGEPKQQVSQQTFMNRKGTLLGVGRPFNNSGKQMLRHTIKHPQPTQNHTTTQSENGQKQELKLCQGIDFSPLANPNENLAFLDERLSH